MKKLEIFADFVNKLSCSEELTSEVKKQRVGKFNTNHYLEVLELLTVFENFSTPSHTHGTQVRIHAPQTNAHIFYNRKMDSTNVDAINVEYKFLYPSRFAKAFVDEGYRTIPNLENIYPLIYRLMTCGVRAKLTENSKWILRYALNGYYGAHIKLETIYGKGESPMVDLFEAYGDLKTAPLLFVNVETICFDPNKFLGSSADALNEVEKRISCIDDVLYMPVRTISHKSQMDFDLYEKAGKLHSYYSHNSLI